MGECISYLTASTHVFKTSGISLLLSVLSFIKTITCTTVIFSNLYLYRANFSSEYRKQYSGERLWKYEAQYLVL